MEQDYTYQVDDFINEDEEDLAQEEAQNDGPLQGLLDFYKEQVQDVDKLGLADIFKQETERFLHDLNKYLQENYELSFTPVDIAYGDGYFIFGSGTNSVVHFHIKEAPEWLFGIWWSPVNQPNSTKENPQYYPDRIDCEFFAQYEDTIDKFKPSNSVFENSFCRHFETEDLSSLYAATQVVLLILKYPYVAFVRDVYWQNLNVNYVTPEEAETIYQEWLLKENAKKLMEQENTQKMLDCLTHIYGPTIEAGDAFIYDEGPCISPRYTLIMRNVWKNNGQENSPDGCFSLFDWGAEGWEDLEEDKALWNKTIEECEARAKDLDTYWFNPVSRWLSILSDENYWKLKQEQEAKK